MNSSTKVESFVLTSTTQLSLQHHTNQSWIVTQCDGHYWLKNTWKHSILISQAQHLSWCRPDNQRIWIFILGHLHGSRARCYHTKDHDILCQHQCYGQAVSLVTQQSWQWCIFGGSRRLGWCDGWYVPFPQRFSHQRCALIMCESWQYYKGSCYHSSTGNGSRKSQMCITSCIGDWVTFLQYWQGTGRAGRDGQPARSIAYSKPVAVHSKDSPLRLAFSLSGRLSLTRSLKTQQVHQFLVAAIAAQTAKTSVLANGMW